jgi:hypothetical protein
MVPVKLGSGGLTGQHPGRLTFVFYLPTLFGVDKQRENGALLIAACIVAVNRYLPDSALW